LGLLELGDSEPGNLELGDLLKNRDILDIPCSGLVPLVRAVAAGRLRGSLRCTRGFEDDDSHGPRLRWRAQPLPADKARLSLRPWEDVILEVLHHISDAGGVHGHTYDHRVHRSSLRPGGGPGCAASVRTGHW